MAKSQTYTTYLRTELDSATRANYARLEQIARSTYNSIAADANRAGVATRTVERPKALTNTRSVAINAEAAATRALGSVQTQQAGAAARVAAANDNINRTARRATLSTQGYTESIKREGLQARVATAENAALARSLTVVGTTLNVVQGPLGPLSGRVAAVGQAIQTLTGITLGLAGAGAALFAFAGAANSYAEVESRLKPLYETQTQVNRAMEDAIGIATRSRSSLSATVDLYSKLTNAGRDFGLAQNQINRVVELASKAATLSGGNAQTREAGLYQFAQGLSSGTLGGDELKSVKENTSELARAIAAGFKNADGSIGTTIANLKELGAQGKLTTDVIVDALTRASTQIETKFARLPPTLSSAATQFATRFTAMVGGLDQATGTTSFLANALLKVADNLRTITGLALGLGAAFVVPRIAGFVSSIASAVAQQQALNTAVQSGNATLLTAQGIQAAKALSAQEAALAEAAAAQSRVGAIQQEIAALKAAQVQYAANATAAQRTAQVSAAAAAQANFSVSIGQPAGNVAGYVTKAAADSRLLNQARMTLNATTTSLSAAEKQLGAAQAAAATASQRATAAVNAATGATAAARTGITLLGGALNIFKAALPVLAITALTSVIFTLATAESSAAQAAREMADAQSTLGRYVDETTGKLLEQNKQLVQARLLKTQDRQENNRSNFQSAQQNFLQTIAPLRQRGRDFVGTGVPANITAAGRAFINASRNGNASNAYKDLRNALDTFAKVGPQAAAKAREIENSLTGVFEAARATSQGSSEIRLLSGNARPGDNQRAFGNFSAARKQEQQAATALTDRQVLANAKLAAAQTAVQKAQANLNKVLADGAAAKKAGTRDEDAYQQSVNAAVQAVEDAKSAEKAAAQAKRDSAKATREAAKEERQRAMEERAAARDRAHANRDSSPQDLEDRAPAMSRQQYLDERIKILQTYDDEMNAIDGLAKASNRADRQRIADAREVQAAIKEINDGFTRDVEVGQLRLQGRDIEAEALSRTLDLVNRIGDKGYEQYNVLVQQGEAMLQINDRLAERERITTTLQSAVDSVRDSTEQFLTNLSSNAPRAAADFGKSLLNSFKAQQARLITSTLFEGIDGKIRDLISGRTALQSNTAFAATQMERGGSAAQKFAEAVGRATEKINAVSSPMDAVTANAIGSPLGNAQDFASSIADAIADERSTMADTGNVGPDGSITVEAKSLKLPEKIVEAVAPSANKKTPTLREIYKQTGESIGEKLDKALGTKFLKGVGGALGTALQGAGKGSVASGLFGLTGIKQNETGAALGGAVGNFIPGLPPGVGAAIGGILGGTIGGLFQKTKKGSTSIVIGSDGLADVGSAYGNNSTYRRNATLLGGGVADQLNSIAEALGADLSGGAVSIGQRKKKYVVDTTGTRKTKGSGTASFDTEEEAVEYAIRDLINDGVLKGISAASQKILQSGQNLEKAITKAALIESIPKQLMQIKDPVRYAVQELNDEFEKVINALNEGGATAQQYAEAQELYDLKRKDAIEQATKGAADALDDFLKNMTGGSDSPLSKRSVLRNAQSEFDKLQADIAAGKSVDQQKLINAAQNLQSAAQGVYGSSSDFFAIFDKIFGTISQARDNLNQPTSVLPGSPFATTAAQDTMSKLSQSQLTATEKQTSVLGSKLDALIEAVSSLDLQANGVTGDRVTPLDMLQNIR